MQEPDIKMADYIFIDVETTGANIHDSSSYFDNHIVKKDMIQIGLAWTEGRDEKIQTAYSLIKPPEEYFEYADKWYKVNGKPNISADLVKDAPAWDKLHPWVTGLIGNRIPVAHNADFDAQVLLDTSFHYGFRFLERPFWKCTKEDAKALLKNEVNNFGLADLCRYFQINQGTHHNAQDDAVACLKVFKELIWYRRRPDWIFV